MKQEIYICDRCKSQTSYYDTFTSGGELKTFDLCDNCVYQLKRFLRND